jgi:hypothetical protein
VDVFTRDSTRPVIEQFSFDMTLGLLTMSFSETMNASSINHSKITLQSSLVEHTLVNATVSITNDDTIEITLDSWNLNEVKRLSPLCTVADQCKMSVLDDFGSDMFSNGLKTLDPVEAIAAANITTDKEGPRLDSFSLNINSGIITLTFDETVRSSSLNVSGISLHDTSENPFILANASAVISPDSTDVHIKFSDSDLDKLKLASALWSSGTATLSLAEAAITDTFNNLGAEATLVTTTDITLDITPPVLEQFNLDLDTGCLKLQFSEVMNITTLKRELFKLLGSNYTDDPNYLQLLKDEN